MSRSPTRIELLLLAVLFLSVAWTTGPALVRQLRLGAALAPLPYSGKRSQVMGPFYGVVKEIDRALPPCEPLAIVFSDFESAFPAAFAGYYLYPRPVRSYYRLGPWKIDPSHPQALALADVHDPQQLRRLDYLEIRRRLHLRTPLTGHEQPPSQESSHFAIPLAGSLDGPGEEELYVVEGVLASPTRCPIALTFYPSGTRRTYVLEPGRPLRFADVVGEAFGRLELGWLEVTASAPVRRAFWYVDHARKQIVPLPVVEQWPSGPQHFEGTAEKLYVVNPASEALELRIEGVTRTLPPRGFLAVAGQGTRVLDASGPFYAFTTQRDAGGRTRFGWPEERR